jgi:hypothetical protein
MITYFADSIAELLPSLFLPSLLSFILSTFINTVSKTIPTQKSWVDGAIVGSNPLLGGTGVDK